MPIKIRTNLAAIIAVWALGVACHGQNQATSAAVETQPALDPTVDKILTRLETREVRDLHAKVNWKLQYVTDTDEDAVTKVGELWYQQQKPVAKFLVHFTAKITGGRKNDLDERHMFDGRWYVEMKSETRTFERREVRREGDVGNPYRIGEGPFPVPFGQKKADILKEFEVSLAAPAETDPPDTDHLKLMPRVETETGRSYKQVDVWVAREGPQHGLPIKLHTSKKDGTGKINSYLTITFADARLNEGFSGSVFELRPPAGYDVHEETLDPITPPEGTPPSGPKKP